MRSSGATHTFIPSRYGGPAKQHRAGWLKNKSCLTYLLPGCTKRKTETESIPQNPGKQQGKRLCGKQKQGIHEKTFAYFSPDGRELAITQRQGSITGNLIALGYCCIIFINLSAKSAIY